MGWLDEISLVSAVGVRSPISGGLSVFRSYGTGVYPPAPSSAPSRNRKHGVGKAIAAREAAAVQIIPAGWIMGCCRWRG
ncbi:hypothetical protein CCHR01_09463 [Colletotrichum chrysophilum]|uniref:Uncharacterized protein n=1 Tax=Colletotrichum chrysophilum TaxID=1836956 RepID=A0AAD9ALS9_9PEZI|nr:hypothetical protein CCHR01_09463 [Colletotrichum chrysophilum]